MVYIFKVSRLHLLQCFYNKTGFPQFSLPKVVSFKYVNIEPYFQNQSSLLNNQHQNYIYSNNYNKFIEVASSFYNETYACLTVIYSLIFVLSSPRRFSTHRRNFDTETTPVRNFFVSFAARSILNIFTVPRWTHPSV